jgi:voltage-gated potassium channel
VLLSSLAAYQAEHATNREFATLGDSLWWGIVTLTTVGYGDIVPQGTAGRLAGVVIMITGIAVLGVLAGSLSALFHVEESSEEGPSKTTEQVEPIGGQAVSKELAALQAQLRTVERRLGELAAVSGGGSDEPGSDSS